jgi:hypothetical protein
MTQNRNINYEQTDDEDEYMYEAVIDKNNNLIFLQSNSDSTNSDKPNKNKSKMGEASTNDSNVVNLEIGHVEHAIVSDFLERNSKGQAQVFEPLAKGTYSRTNTQLDPTGISIYEDNKFYLIKYEDIVVEVCIYCVFDGGARFPQLLVSSNQFLSQDKIVEIGKDIHESAIKNCQFQNEYLMLSIGQSGSIQQLEKADELNDNYDKLIIDEKNHKFNETFIRAVKNGKNLRYLLSGEAGTGKTASIRHIINSLRGHATIIEPSNMDASNFGSFLTEVQHFDNPVLVLDDIDLYLMDRNNGGNLGFLSSFLTHFDGIQKKNLSVLASTNDKKLVDKAAERPGRFHITYDFNPLQGEQIDKCIDMYFPERLKFKSINKYLKSKTFVTGAFIHNLTENLIEMEGDEEWDEESLKTFVESIYTGFYEAVRNQSRPGY